MNQLLIQQICQPSTSSSNAPSKNPTPSPTSYEDTINITSNHFINENFGLNNFKFAAAIDQCMNEDCDSDIYINYECFDENTISTNTYSDDQCSEVSMIASDSFLIYNQTNNGGNEFVCNATENTFVGFEIFSRKSCPVSDNCLRFKKTSIFIAYGVCVSYDNNNHYKLFCNGYKADDDLYSF